MLQAAVCDGLTLDALPLDQDVFSAAEVDVGRGEIVDALMVAVVIVMLDKRANPTFEVAR